MSMPKLPSDAGTPRQFPTTIDEVVAQFKEVAEDAIQDGRAICVQIENRAMGDEFTVPVRMLECADHILCIHREADQSLGDVVVTVVKSRDGEFEGL